MNIRYATDRDAKNWDEYVESHPDSTPYHRYAWKQTIQSSYKHDCYYLIAEDGSNNIIGILPTVKIKPFLISGQLCALPYCDIGESLANNTETSDKLINYALVLGKKLKLGIFEHRASFAKSSSGDNPQTGKKVRMLLDLPSSSEELMRSFKSKHRSQIRKAEKNGLTVKLGNNPDYIKYFYDVFSHNMHKLGSPVHSKKWFSQINENFAQQMITSTVWLDDKIIAAGIVLLNSNKAAIPWASTKAEYNKLAPNMLLYWSLLEYVSDNGYKQFDFGRSTMGEGTYKFKQQWGAQAVPLNWQTFDLESLSIVQQFDSNRSKKYLRSLVETLWKKLPFTTSVLIGSKIRKYISL